MRTLASAGGPDNLVMLDPVKYKSRPRVPEPPPEGSSSQPKWQVGEQEFEAYMRMLDNLVGERPPSSCLNAPGKFMLNTTILNAWYLRQLKIPFPTGFSSFDLVLPLVTLALYLTFY